MKDAEDEYEKAEKRLQEQLRDIKEQLNMAQRVLHAFQIFVLFLFSCMFYIQYRYLAWIGTCLAVVVMVFQQFETQLQSVIVMSTCFILYVNLKSVWIIKFL